MATYNGGQNIEAQISSIISQTFRDWRLVIHDDGSSDQTVETIKKWCNIDKRIILVEDGVRCGGASENFMHVTAFADADFVMYADQDDIWLSNKIEFMLGEIEKKDNSKPQLFYTNLMVWIPNKGFDGFPVRTYPTDLKNFLFLNTSMHGCISIFNRALFDLLKVWKGVTPMHDQSLQLLAIGLGEVTYSDLPLMLYRRHNTSVTGDTITKKNDVRRLASSTQTPVMFGKWYFMVEYFEQNYSAELSESDKEIVRTFLELKDKSKIGKISAVLKNGFKLYDSTFRLIVKILIRPYIA